MSTPERRILQRMKTIRKRKGLSQEEIGRRLGVTLRTYARWERGESSGYVGHINEIAKALECTPDDILGGDQPIGTPTVEELSAKLDLALDELKRLREDLQERPKVRATRAR